MITFFPILHPATGLPEGTSKTIAQVAGGIPLIGGAAAIAAPAITPFIASLAAGKGIPLGTVAATTVHKTIIGGGAVTVGAAGAGLLAGTLLGGGGTQEQKQAAEQDLKQQLEQKQAAALKAMLRDFQAKAKMVSEAKAAGRAEAEVKAPVTVTPTYHVTAGGGVEIGGVTTYPTTITETHTITGVSQEPTQAQIGQQLGQLQSAIAAQEQRPIVVQLQEAQQEGGGTNWLLLAVLGAGAAYLFLRRKKRAR